MREIREQQWEDQSFCDDYEEMWEISSEEVHYGWLANGETSLKLLGNIELQDANVVDVGCGMAHNLIAVSKAGAFGYGVDISSCMLSKAYDLIQSEGMTDRITLEHGDMRDFGYFPGLEFQLALSVYSMEYLSGVQELRRVLAHLYNALVEGGTLVMCFTHPSQVHRYPELLNSSIPVGVGKYKTFNYSYKDATQALIKCGFHVERIIEQTTLNPSQISYSEGKKFPYHFREGRNPCNESYDSFSNSSPHTVIYKATKPSTNKGLAIPRIGEALGTRKLWGYKRKIKKIVKVDYLGYLYKATFLEPMDNVLGILDVISFNVPHSGMPETSDSITVETYDSHESFAIRSDSILGIVHRILMDRGLLLKYRALNVQTEDNIAERKIWLESIVGLEESVEKVFGTKKIGLLTFLNSEEPVGGELATDSMRPRSGDVITLSYIALKERAGSFNPLQTRLFE